MAEEWVYGLNPVLEAIRSGRNIKAVFISSGRHDKVLEIKREAENRHIPLRTADISFFDGTFPKGHQGVAARVQEWRYVEMDRLLEIADKKGEAPFFILLDEVVDPRNLGAILRVADAGGVHGIIIEAHRSAGLGSTVAKTSAGAIEHVPVSRVPNLKNAIKIFSEEGISVVGAEAQAEKTIWDVDLNRPIALILGSEGKGIRRTLRQRCDELISIPIVGSVNSLNVSVAAGIIVYEVLRQRQRK